MMLPGAATIVVLTAFLTAHVVSSPYISASVDILVSSATGLPTPYAVRTVLTYPNAVHVHGIPSYAPNVICPVLTQCMVLPGLCFALRQCSLRARRSDRPIILLLRYAMSGIDTVHAAARDADVPQHYGQSPGKF
eukprot:2051427-Rhodomonas_salina.6